MDRVERRAVLRTGLLAGGVGVAAVAATRAASGPGPAGQDAASPASGQGSRAARPATLPFRGPHQAGVVDEPQPFAAFVGLDLPKGATRQTCRRLLRVWTDDIERLMAARGPLTDLEPELAAVPSRLSVTVAVGPGFYAAAGLEADRPSWLAPLPPFEVDRFEPHWPQTDLLLQIRADSPVAVAHAQRRLVVGAQPLAVQRWVQRGFREPLTAVRPGMPFRNLFGQVDGTVQPATGGAEDGLIWLGSGGLPAPQGLAGGTSLVIRRIAMNLDTWDEVDRAGREHAIGRRIATGAPLTGRVESDVPDLAATDALGFPVIDPVSHMRRAMPLAPHERILRAPYSYDDAPGPGERSNSGLVFVSFQADPVRQFVPIQQRLAEADLLNIWTTPVSSGVYAVLPGAGAGEDLGAALLA
ncbi:Dyp-type peroxidase [Intrasporangium calvum]|uniref:Dyp-type peroxidase n=1 Tax=Intrasporangium calvum TaxID=53358 RepID=A0ABT5GFN1_9MICO|nr:Dyp-type peroxidase [Intrasporangium calvum]MDC5697009.1 Dyp-type peroxidase [Intrasporangium calvum]